MSPTIRGRLLPFRRTGRFQATRDHVRCRDVGTKLVQELERAAWLHALTPSEPRGSRYWHYFGARRGTGTGTGLGPNQRPDDLSAKAIWLKEDDCLHRQLPSRFGAPGGEIALDGLDRIGVGQDVKRAADQVDSPSAK